MHQRLMQTVEDGDIEVIDMWEEGDGLQDVTFVKRKVAKVLMELLSDECIAGRLTSGSETVARYRGLRPSVRPFARPSVRP